ncbi:MAG: pyridoxal phosphate-dependent aminotransferase [Pseudomonadota bacterium]
MKADALTGALTRPARDAPESRIVEVAAYGRGREDVIPLWVGEGDRPTPGFICDAAARSLAAGETFYTYQRGIPELRSALADYHTALFGGSFADDRFYVTGSGMQAIQLAVRMVAGAGDEILVPTPAWINIIAATGINGARPIEIPLSFGADGWTLDLDRVAASITPKTKAIFFNSPSNPTGWVADESMLRAVYELAQRHGLWILADETYSRYFYGDAQRAPSFYDFAPADARILYVNTFSKNWAMTGWRVGWISAPPELGQVIENLIQYSTSGVPVFMQRGCVAALRDGEDFVAEQVARARAGRDLLSQALSDAGCFRFADPAGAFYHFFAIDGQTDTLKLGLRLVDEANVGLAPGDAFGAAGAGFLRLCFLRSADQLQLAAERLRDWARTQ